MYFPHHYFYAHNQAISGGGFWGVSPEAWAAIGTFLAVIAALLIALFQDLIRSWWNRARLDMKINLVPPDCHKIQLKNPQTGEAMGYAIYLRIKVQHIRGKTAENVEIMIGNFWHIRENGTIDIVRHFLPMNLKWSHFDPPVHSLRIPVGLFRHCDLGPILHPGENVLKLDTIVQPNAVEGGEVPNIIRAGRYEFELLLSGDNVKPVTKRFSFELDNIWSNNEMEMLQDHIKITEI